MHLVGSFDLALLTTGPAHKLGHALNLVFSFGFPISNVEIIDACLSDHSAVVFEWFLPFSPAKSPLPVHYSRYINYSPAKKFSEALIVTPNSCTIESSLPHLSTEELCSLFNIPCSTIMDSLKLKIPKPKSLPWLDNTTRALRRDCRKAERK